MKIPFRKPIKKRIGIAILCILLSALFFAGGYATFYFTMDKSISSLWWAKKYVDEYYIYDINDKDYLSYAMNGVNAALDPYSCYFSAEELSADLSSREGNQAGLGITFFTTEDELFLYRVNGNSPAERAGIKAGNYLVSYGKSEEEQIQATSFDAFSDYLYEREAGEEFFVGIAERSKGEPVYYAIAKEDYRESYVTYRSSETAYRFTQGEWIGFDGATQMPQDTGYIRLNMFYGDAAAQMKTALEQFRSEGKKNLVLDLRGNGGGSLDVLCQISAYLLRNNESSSPVVAIARDKKGGVEKFHAKNALPFETYFSKDSRVTILADRNSASASECLIGALVDYGTVSFSDIVVTQDGDSASTYGKGIMQTTFTNPATGEGIKLTSAKIYWPLSQICIHGTGVTQEMGATLLEGDIAYAYSDAELSRVLSLLFPAT